MDRLKKGYVQVYTGDGKGKTTAAIGQGVRACGRDLKVYMVQFLKSSDSGELHSLKKLEPGFKVFRFEKERGFFWTLNDEEKVELKEEVLKAFDFCKNVVEKEECDLLILDEILGAVGNKLISEEELLKLIKDKPLNMEIVLTGRNVPFKIAEAADLITEMLEIKHYMGKGIPAREGIEF